MRPKVPDKGGGPTQADKGGGPTYADMTKEPQSDLEDRNVLIIRVRKSPEARNRFFDDSICEKMCQIIGVVPIRDTLGCQYLMDRGDVIV